FLKSDGSLWAMGDNENGQLGDGTYVHGSPYGTNHPEQIVASDVTAIAAGNGLSIFTKSGGSLWYMGFTGYGYGRDYNYPGQPWDPTNYTTVPQQIVSGGVTAIAAGAGQV